MEQLLYLEVQVLVHNNKIITVKVITKREIRQYIKKDLLGNNKRTPTFYVRMKSKTQETRML